jgi:hypothetical protein
VIREALALARAGLERFTVEIQIELKAAEPMQPIAERRRVRAMGSEAGHLNESGLSAEDMGGAVEPDGNA